MELITGLFILGLYKATEKIWGKGFDAAWGPVDEALKARFAHWAGKGKEAERRAAFAKAAEIARANTLHVAADPQQVEKILSTLNGEQDKKGAKALAEEGAKLMLFSAAPDVPRLTRLCQERLQWDAVWGEGEPPAAESVAFVLSDFLTNLREALLDQEPYHDLIQKDMRRALNEILAELRPVAYDDEATYRYQVAEMYRQLEFVGIPELKERRPITVEDIFIHLQAEREAERLETPEELLARGMQPGDQRLQPKRPIRQRVDANEALHQTKRLVVLGDPGTGKTTLLKYWTITCAEGRSETELGLKADEAGLPLPILIPLREFAAECAGRDQDYCLLDYLYTHAREHLLLNLPRNFFEEALEAGRCLVCLDGLDEVWAVGQRKAVSDAVKALATRFPQSRCIVTSRIVGYGEAPLDRREFTHYTVLPLEDKDIQEFVRRWYTVRERDPIQRKQKVDDLIATVEREPRIQDLARTPLLLTIIALVHRIEAELPHERVKLYDKCVTTLVDTWEEVKGLSIEEKQRPFYRYRRRLLERLAYELHTRATPLVLPAGGETTLLTPPISKGTAGGVQTVRAGDLELLLARFLMENQRLGYADDPDGARDEAQAFVRLARGRTGLLVERGEGVFGFPHLTFQEYLAACDIENRCIHQGVDALWEEIEPHLHNPHWQEVILLLLGSLNKYDEPPTLLVERILEAGEEDKFEPVLHRHLYLVTRALADRVDIADTLHRRAVNTTLKIACTAPRWEAQDAFAALSWLTQDPYAADGLLSLVCNEQADAGKRRDAAFTLGQLGRAKEAVEVLLAIARNEQVDAGVRRDATAALGQLGRAKEAVEVLLALARDKRVTAWVRSAAASVLGQAGYPSEATEVLLVLARDTQVDTSVRSAAASILGQLGYAEESVLNGLLALAHDEQVAAGIRSAAASSLGQLGRAEEKASNGLLALTRDSQMAAWVRSAAAASLGQLGRTEEAAQVLLTLAHDEQVAAWVRRAAASSLGQLGHVEEAAEVLLALAGDHQVVAGVRHAAASTLGQLGRAREAAEILLALARDEQIDTGVRSAAASDLGQLGHSEEEVLDSLLELARDAQVDTGVRNAAASALSRLGRAKEAAEALLALAQDKKATAWARRDAASALGSLGLAREAAEILLALARDEQVGAGVRRDAASTLGQLGCVEETVLDGLLALARDEQVVDWVRSAAASALGQLGRAAEAAEILLALARDRQRAAWVRSAATAALEQLGRIKEGAEILLVLAQDEQAAAWGRRAAYENLKRLVGGMAE